MLSLEGGLSGNGYVLDKFSLYYPDNSMVPSEWHTTGWDLLSWLLFRTAALTGTLNRGGLAGLRDGPACRDHGLVIDRDSAYEDCAYIGVREGESKEDRMRRIEGMVTVMEEVYGGSLLALSYDPEEKARCDSGLRSEGAAQEAAKSTAICWRRWWRIELSGCARCEATHKISRPHTTLSRLACGLIPSPHVPSSNAFPHPPPAHAFHPTSLIASEIVFELLSHHFERTH